MVTSVYIADSKPSSQEENENFKFANCWADHLRNSIQSAYAEIVACIVAIQSAYYAHLSPYIFVRMHKI